MLEFSQIKINLGKMDDIGRTSLSGENKGRGELHVYLVYAILIVIAIIFLVLITHVR
jgi:hypothetical protein